MKITIVIKLIYRWDLLGNLTHHGVSTNPSSWFLDLFAIKISAWWHHDSESFGDFQPWLEEKVRQDFEIWWNLMRRRYFSGLPSIKLEMTLNIATINGNSSSNHPSGRVYVNFAEGKFCQTLVHLLLLNAVFQMCALFFYCTLVAFSYPCIVCLSTYTFIYPKLPKL